jgi:2-polyprenyl-3-methyl-5-hydroxy-6-metoxy-1,4-benzoquinol methylase
MTKYYYREHISGYERVRAENKTAWAEIHGGSGFENFASRSFLEMALPQLRFSSPHPTVLELGCGTGPGACFLAERGFRVKGIDLIPLAIEIAREQSAARGLEIRYQVMDVTQLTHTGNRYDLIVDSYCLQGIVTDADRQRVFAAVRARLKRTGTYLVSSAMFDARRFCKAEHIVDAETGIVYHPYGEHGIIDPETSIVYERLASEEADLYRDTICVGNGHYLANRRHYKPRALRAEIEAAGFQVHYQDSEYGGNLICTHARRVT